MEASLLEPAPVPTTKVPQTALPSVPARQQPAQQVRGGGKLKVVCGGGGAEVLRPRALHVGDQKFCPPGSGCCEFLRLRPRTVRIVLKNGMDHNSPSHSHPTALLTAALSYSLPCHGAGPSQDSRGAGAGAAAGRAGHVRGLPTAGWEAAPAAEAVARCGGRAAGRGAQQARRPLRSGAGSMLMPTLHLHCNTVGGLLYQRSVHGIAMYLAAAGWRQLGASGARHRLPGGWRHRDVGALLSWRFSSALCCFAQAAGCGPLYPACALLYHTRMPEQRAGMCGCTRFAVLGPAISAPGPDACP